jgi:hypothetical protein
MNSRVRTGLLRRLRVACSLVGLILGSRYPLIVIVSSPVLAWLGTAAGKSNESAPTD